MEEELFPLPRENHERRLALDLLDPRLGLERRVLEELAAERRTLNELHTVARYGAAASSLIGALDWLGERALIQRGLAAAEPGDVPFYVATSLGVLVANEVGKVEKGVTSPDG